MKKIIITFLFCLGVIAQNSFASAPEEDITIWGTCVSPFTRKVVSVMEEKGLKYQLNPILPSVLLKATGQSIPETFASISPLGKIPAIQVKDFSISDSTIIVGYVERKWPVHPVYPSNQEELAKALWYEKYADTVMTDTFHKIFFEKVVKPLVLKTEGDANVIQQQLAQVPTILNYLEGELAKNQKQYLVNDKLTIADIAIAHHFISMQMSKTSLPLEQYPHLSRYLQRVLVHPSIQAAVNKI